MNKKSPKIRFKGFTDDWEQRKLEQLAQFNPKSSLPDKFEYVDLESVVGTEMISHRTETKENAPSRAQRLATQGDVFYQTVRPYQKNNYLFDLPHNNYVFSTGYAQLRPFGDSYFLLSRLQDDKFIFNVLQRSTGTSYPAINSSDLSQIEVGVPLVVEEQIKIGVFFKNLDHIIALHQDAIQRQQDLKKALLQNLFPLNGERIPTVRFATFKEEWEQRKFKDIVDSKDGIRRGPFGSALKKDLFVKESEYVVYEQQNAIYDRFDTRYNITKEKYNELIKFKVEPGDFIMSGAGTIGRISMIPNGIKSGVFNQALIRFRLNYEKTNSKYFLQLMRSETMQRKLTGSNPGSAMVNLMPMSEVKEWDILVPNISEQKLLGEFFTNLDNNITLYQQALDKLNLLKQSLLQKMFV